MPEQITKKDREKKLRGLTYLAVLPLYLVMVDECLCDAWLAVFGSLPKAGVNSLSAASLLIGRSRFLAVLVMSLMSYMWARPAILYAKDPLPSYREKMRSRVGRVYPGMAVMFAAALLARLVMAFTAGAVPRLAILTEVLPTLLVSTLVQACILMVYVDSQFAKSQAFMELLFSKEELYLPRKGFSVPLYLKVSGLVGSCALLPFFFVYVALFRELPLGVYLAPLNAMLFMSAITLVIGLGFVFNGIQKPLDGLIEKMRRVSEGDYDVKTRVYFSDEIARLKAGFNTMIDGLKERKELQDTFGKYLSIEIARELIKNKKVDLGGEYMDAAVMFCDIRNFTPLSENMSASELIDFLNTYFHYIAPPIAANNGVINKFIGDAVMAVFTPLLGSGHYASDAVRAALEMRKALADFNASGKSPVPVKFGIGVHSGRLVAGNIGTLSRQEYTFIGDTVNTASRVESKTKDFDTDILVSHAVVELLAGRLGDVRFENVGRVDLKGKREAMELYKVL